ncbi:hypothetical protein PG988_016062 [Apiospora saccharicola]
MSIIITQSRTMPREHGLAAPEELLSVLVAQLEADVAGDVVEGPDTHIAGVGVGAGREVKKHGAIAVKQYRATSRRPRYSQIRPGDTPNGVGLWGAEARVGGGLHGVRRIEPALDPHQDVTAHLAAQNQGRHVLLLARRQGDELDALDRAVIQIDVAGTGARALRKQAVAPLGADAHVRDEQIVVERRRLFLERVRRGGAGDGLDLSDKKTSTGSRSFALLGLDLVGDGLFLVALAHDLADRLWRHVVVEGVVPLGQVKLRIDGAVDALVVGLVVPTFGVHDIGR